MPIKVTSRIVDAKVPTRSTALDMAEHKRQLEMFSEARKARAQEKMLKLKEVRMKSRPGILSKVHSTIGPGLRSAPSVSKSSPRTAQKVTQPVASKATASAGAQETPSLPKKRLVVLSSKIGSGSNTRHHVKPAPSRSVNTSQKTSVRQTKTSQLRIGRANPYPELLKALQNRPGNINSIPSLNIATGGTNIQSDALKKTLPKALRMDTVEALIPKKTSLTRVPSVRPESKKVGFASEPRRSITPSRIPRRKTSIASPLQHTPTRTPKPSILREKLSVWLEQNGRSLDGFKHLSCFGIHDLIKRPQTPFRKVIQSTNKLMAIPESVESSPNGEIEEEGAPQAEESVLNTTYTMEEEDKENVAWSHTSDVLRRPYQMAVGPLNVQSDLDKVLDEACGVLTELHQLLKDGYPPDQCELWVRAIRRRFPQCGDESVYWECLASLEERRGDLHSAVAYYERAVMQGAEVDVKNCLDNLRLRLAALNIDCPSTEENITEVTETPNRRRRNSYLDRSNIIRSSAIEFAVQKKNQSTQKQDGPTEEREEVIVATPVRRSTRSTTSPFHKSQTPGLTCVRSLDVLEPRVRKSLVFHSNVALEPRE